jgi:hypothetical protein
MRFFGKKKKTITAYWWLAKDGRAVPNFGDLLAPLLLARFADLDNVERSPIAEAEIVSVGSVIEHIPAGWRGYIVGSGLLRETSALKFNPHDGVKVLAVRGPLTARLFQGIGTYALGDPGILADELLEERPEKQWDLGIVPHWQDQELAGRFAEMIKPPFTTLVIDPKREPIVVLREIAACKRIVTSSLHGMIAADAFGIPRRVEACDAMAADGGLFKFRDYSASIRTAFETGKMITPPTYETDELKFQIFDAYRELSRAYGKS